MKYTSILFIGALLFASLPTAPAFALSCIDPAGMINHVVENDDYIVVTATPTEQKEHVKDKADETDPNKQYDSGYSSQLLAIEAVHKGSAPDSQWVYFERNGTWNYLCAGAPAPLNTDQVYVLNQSYERFGMTTVVAVYEADSELAKELLSSIEKASTEETPEPTSYEAGKEYWLQNLIDQLSEMAFIVKVKFSEWNFWRAQ